MIAFIMASHGHGEGPSVGWPLELSDSLEASLFLKGWFMSKPNKREKQRQFLRIQRELREREKKRKSLNPGEGMDKGQGEKSSLK